MDLLPDHFDKAFMKDPLDLFVDSVRARDVPHLPACSLVHQPISVDRPVAFRLLH
jgi:hypothetical protein